MFKRIASVVKSFTKAEKTLWCVSVICIVLSYAAFGGKGALTLVASLIGVTSLIFNARGNPFGQALMVVFSVLYGIISYSFAYYGEMLTYVGMTAPMALFSLIVWLRHPYKGNHAEVEVARLSKKDCLSMLILTVGVTVIFYFILAYFHTANLLPSTISVTTSFLAVYLTYKRSAAYALAYAANDVVLIVLWVLAAQSDRSYLSVVVCFAAFLLNDLYGYYSWQRMEKRQSNTHLSKNT